MFFSLIPCYPLNTIINCLWARLYSFCIYLSSNQEFNAISSRQYNQI